MPFACVFTVVSLLYLSGGVGCLVIVGFLVLGGRFFMHAIIGRVLMLVGLGRSRRFTLVAL